MIQLIGKNLCLTALVAAADQCYFCKNGLDYVACQADYKNNTVTCNFDDSYCVTVEKRDKQGTTQFYRGCDKRESFLEGCISTIDNGIQCASACKGWFQTKLYWLYFAKR